MKTSQQKNIIILAILVVVVILFFVFKGDKISNNDNTDNINATTTTTNNDTALSAPKKIVVQEEKPAPVVTLAKSLDGKTFRLASFNSTPVSGERPSTITFLNGRLNAKFCNNMSGDYSIEGDMLKATMISTLMFCQQPFNIMSIEQSFGAIVNSGVKVTLSGTVLTLNGKNGDVLVFVSNN